MKRLIIIMLIMLTGLFMILGQEIKISSLNYSIDYVKRNNPAFMDAVIGDMHNIIGNTDFYNTKCLIQYHFDIKNKLESISIAFETENINNIPIDNLITEAKKNKINIEIINENVYKLTYIKYYL